MHTTASSQPRWPAKLAVLLLAFACPHLVLAEAEPPTLTVSGTTAFVAGGGPVVVAPDLRVGGDDALTRAKAVIYNLQSGDVLGWDASLAAILGITGSYNATNGTLSLSGQVGPGFYELVLRSVTFHNTLPLPASTNRIVLFRLYEHDVEYGGADDDPSTGCRTITMMILNTPPVANPDQYSVNENTTGTFSRAQGVLANDTDAQNDPLTCALVSGPLHGTLVLNADGSFTYAPSSNYYGADSFAYVANDGQFDSAAATVRLTIFAPPAVAAPGAQVLINNGLLLFAAVNGNSILVADPDSVNLTASLTVASGTLAVVSTNGLALANGSSGVTNLVMYGPIASLNAALQTLTYRPFAGSFGVDQLTILVIDEGGRSNAVPGVVPLALETPLLGGITAALLDGLNHRGAGRLLTNATVISMDSNLVKSVVGDPANHVVNMTATGRQDGGTNHTTVTLRAWFDDGSSQLVPVPLIIYQPTLTNVADDLTYAVSSFTPLFNPQINMFEQKVSVQNHTPFGFAALRILATNLPANIRLYNASGTNNGRPYIACDSTIPAGGKLTLTLQYFNPNRTAIVSPLKLELLGQPGVSALTQPVVASPATLTPYRGYAPDGREKFYLGFPTRAGGLYFIQYKDALNAPWKTSPVPLAGTGQTLQWMDDGPPNTDSPRGVSRFYQLISQ